MVHLCGVTQLFAVFPFGLKLDIERTKEFTLIIRLLSSNNEKAPNEQPGTL